MKKNSKIYNMPKVKNSVVGRTSTLRGAFVQSVLPKGDTTIKEDELILHLDVLNMSKENICCAYCGGEFNSWDHINPLVSNKGPTGYINEMNNLLPCCSSCNSSKGSKNWKIWMESKNGKMSKIYNENPVEYMKRMSLIEKYTTIFPVTYNEKLAKLKNVKEWQELEKDLNVVLQRWQEQCEHILKNIIEK